jgi:hypothetical protein
MARRLTRSYTHGGTQGTTDDGTLAATHVLAQHHASHSTYPTPKQDPQIVRVRRGTQGRESQNGARDQRRRGNAGCTRFARGKQHKWLVGLGPYRQTWRFVIL